MTASRGACASRTGKRAPSVASRKWRPNWGCTCNTRPTRAARPCTCPAIRSRSSIIRAAYAAPYAERSEHHGYLVDRCVLPVEWRVLQPAARLQPLRGARHAARLRCGNGEDSRPAGHRETAGRALCLCAEGRRMTFTLEVNTDNAAFGVTNAERNAELARLLRIVAHRLDGSDAGNILDANGN